MNKLVSKNPVQRFKQGKKIVRAFRGYRMNSSGQWQFIDDTPTRERKTYSSDIRNINPEKIVPQKDGRTIAKINGQWYNQKGQRVVNFGGTQPIQQQPEVQIEQQTQKLAPVTRSVGNSFRTAFDQARNSGKQEFTWNGKKYNTMKKGETKEQWLSNLKPSSLPELPTSEQLVQQVTQNTPVVESVPQAGTDTIQNQLTGMQKVVPATGTYRINPTLPKLNRSDTRWVINDALGKNAYNFTGAQRRALRQYLNGEQYDANDLAAFGNLDIFNKYKSTQSYKKGGNMLPSRNIVERFKQRNFR